MSSHPGKMIEASLQVFGNGDNEAVASVQGQCLNICEGGLMLQLSQPIPLLSEVVFHVEDLSFEGTGTVCQCGNVGDYCVVGLEFSDGLRYDPATL